MKKAAQNGRLSVRTKYREPYPESFSRRCWVERYISLVPCKVGPGRLELPPSWLRARHAAANTLIPYFRMPIRRTQGLAGSRKNETLSTSGLVLGSGKMIRTRTDGSPSRIVPNQ